ncbi:MAG: CHAT domain-containing tetratricopeptide repeat protein, partial [Planctomycetota bacterium]
AGARELDQAVLEARARVLPADHPLRLRAQQSLAATLGLLGDKEGARELVASLLAAMRSRALALQCEAPRLAREGAYIELRRFPDAFQLCDLVDPEHTLERELFATLETTRLAASAGLDASHALREDAGLAAEMREIARTRSQLNDLAASGPLDVDAAQSWRDELFALSEKRDRAERELRRKLAAAGAKQTEIDADALGRRLAPGTAALSFLRYARHSVQDPVTGARTPSTDALVAFVVKPGGSVARVDLGPTAELETLVQDWRAALGRPLGARGIGVEVRDGGLEGRDDPALIGARLRERVLDPLLAILPDVRALHVVLDDMLHLVPLDALPLGSGLVGERIAIHLEVSLARLLGPQAEPATEGVLLVAGGLAYDAEPGASLALGATIPPFQLGALRSGAATFAFLPGTVTEAESVARLYSEAFERDALELIGSAGTKAALHAAATEVRFLHLATHGWFAGEGLRSRLDPTPGSGADEFARAEETRTGFAPETLCGLALSGANRGADDLGRVVGILTAEELASFDLHNCELAVLSACETNVGLRRAGQGIQSLQAALHAAGARSSITSLWKVDDAATRRLFEHFYAKLWSQRLAKHEALWQAKMALRAEGLPPRDWAAWVLSGDQD